MTDRSTIWSAACESRIDGIRKGTNEVQGLASERCGPSAGICPSSENVALLSGGGRPG